MRNLTRLCALIAIAVSAMAVAVAVAVAGTALGSELNRESLLGATGYRAPVNLSEYTPPVDAAAPSQRFEGRLTLTRKGRNGFKWVFVDSSFVGPGHRDVGGLPAFDFEFVQDGADLIPVRRGTIPGDHPSWEIILEPGRVWDVATDGGYSRASLPFTLEERNENCMHNGVLTFLFKSDGVISAAAWQVSSETCFYEKFDAWGWLDARYTPGKVVGADDIVTAYRAEVAARTPVRPIAQLARDHSGANPANFGTANEITPEHMTAYGFFMDGVHYAGGCETRHGPYPFCDVMDLPSYSLAKSIAGGMGLMRLELLYPGVADALIRDHVPGCATDDRWAGVTLANTTDMATGLYRSASDEVDEAAEGVGRFFYPADHDRKIRYACREYSRKSPPGSLWVYHTSDTYVLGTALNHFVREKRGAATDYYRDVLTAELWQPLALSPSLWVTRRTYDYIQQPFTGYGLTLHRDDIVRIAKFLSIDEGRIAGKPMLDAAMLSAAMQKDPKDRGLQASNAEFRYNNGFWAYNVARVLGCKGETWVPYMSGFGGLSVVMLPNATIYYYVSDGGELRWASAAAESNRIKSFCAP